jgi:hypothetical protein
LEEAGMNGITFLLEAASREQAELLQDEIEALAPRNGKIRRYRPLDPNDKASLLHALEKEGNGLLVLGGRELLKRLPPLDEFLGGTEMSLLLLGNA